VVPASNRTPIYYSTATVIATYVCRQGPEPHVEPADKL
jgi:hypothetical protein